MRKGIFPHLQETTRPVFIIFVPYISKKEREFDDHCLTLLYMHIVFIGCLKNLCNSSQPLVNTWEIDRLCLKLCLAFKKLNNLILRCRLLQGLAVCKTLLSSLSYLDFLTMVYRSVGLFIFQKMCQSSFYQNTFRFFLEKRSYEAQPEKGTQNMCNFVS